jgi:hypothetical protein
MDKPSSSLRDLARQLLTASQTGSGPHVPEVVAVIERLRISLAKFAGDAGFESLLRRALVLASADVPSLQNVKIGANGRLDGVGPLPADTGTGALGGEAAVAIAAHLLGLLVAFIGEPLTLRLLRESWPDTRITFKSREADQ